MRVDILAPRHLRSLVTLLPLLALLAPGPATAVRRQLLNTVSATSAAFIDLGEYQAYVDTVHARGISRLRVAGVWRMKCYLCAPDTIEFNTNPAPGVYDFSAYFERLDYAIVTKGMKAVVCFNLTGRFDSEPLDPGAQRVLPAFLGSADVMLYRNASGQDLRFSSNKIKSPRFEEPGVRAAILDFVTAVVTQFLARYGNDVLAFSFTFGQYGESEYPLVPYPGICDTSPEAEAAFQAWLAAHYATPEHVSTAWGRSPPFTSFDEIEILDGAPPPLRGIAPPAYLDFAAYREAALGAFLADIRDRVHAAGGRIFAQFGSVWDANASVRGTLGFGQHVGGLDLVLIDDAPTYDHNFSMDYTRTNSPGVPFGNEVDAPCVLGCESGKLPQCCDIATFPDYVNIPLGIAQMNAQVSESYERGATWVDLANWDNFYTEAFALYATAVANAVTLAEAPVSAVVADDTMRVSLRDLYVHHHDQGYVNQLIAAHHALGGETFPIAVVLDYDLAPPPVAAVPGAGAPRLGVTLAPVGPNPGGGPARVRFTLERRERVVLRVFDVAGREVAVLAGREFGPGPHELVLGSGGLVSGVYVIRLETPSAVLARKLEVLR